MRCKAGMFSRRVIASAEPPFSAVAMLLHMEGANGSTTVTDSSLAPRVIRLMSGAAISTENARFGSSSLKGRGFEYEYTQAEAVPLVFGSAAFTLEYFMRLNAAWDVDFVYLYNISTYSDLSVFLSSSGNVSISAGSGSPSAAWSIPINSWFHVAIVREGTVIRLYLNGVQVVSSSTNRNFGNATFLVESSGNANLFTDEVRLTLGHARYLGGASFTPPAAPFPDA